MLYFVHFKDARYEESLRSVVMMLLYTYIKLRSRNSLSPCSSYSIFQSFKILMIIRNYHLFHILGEACLYMIKDVTLRETVGQIVLPPTPSPSHQLKYLYTSSPRAQSLPRSVSGKTEPEKGQKHLWKQAVSGSDFSQCDHRQAA